MSRKNLKFIIAYDGTGFAGFQRQGAGERTVQGVIEDALLKLTGEVPKLTAAGRTDAGVHAMGQVINFMTSSSIPTERWLMALNSKLPEDVVARQVEEVSFDFHARYLAKKKTYRYQLDRNVWPDVFERNYTYHYPRKLYTGRMREAAAYLIGTKDFKAFSASGSPVKTTVRNLMRLDITESPDRLSFIMEADGFLYKMVRNIVGTLLLVGEGRLFPEDINRILMSGDRNNAGPTAPPQGLFLVKVDYP